MFSLGGAFDSPTIHHDALERLHKALEQAGVPNKIIIDLIDNASGDISVPGDVMKQLSSLHEPILDLDTYKNDFLQSELDATPMYSTWHSSEQLKLKKKLLVDHKALIEQREYARNLAEKEIHHWKKVITPLKEKQMSLCEVVMKLCDATIINQLMTNVNYTTIDKAVSLKHNVGMLINEIIRLTELTNNGENPEDRLHYQLFATSLASDALDVAAQKLVTIFRRYRMLKSSSTTDPVALALSLKEKEKEIIKNFIYHGIGNTDDELYIYLFELLNGRPPISIPDNFTDLMSLLNQCKADIIAGKSISLNIMKRMTISCATVNQNVPTNLKQVPDVPDAKVDSTPSVPKPPKKNKKTRADAAKVKACKDAARTFAEQPCYRDVTSGTTEQYCPRLRNTSSCPFNHDVAQAKAYFSSLGTAVTNENNNGYLPLLLCNTVTGATLTPWYPRNTILLDEGSNVHCANSTLMDMSNMHTITPKYNGTIGGWITITQTGKMQHTDLLCDYTPYSPFNIISKERIKHDSAWSLNEEVIPPHNQKCYTLTRFDGLYLRFVPVNGVYMYIMETPQYIALQHNTVAATTALPQQYMQNVAQLTFSSAEKHGLMRIYPLLESGLSYSEIESLVRTKHINNINLTDIANAKLTLGYDRPWLAGTNQLSQFPPPVQQIPRHVQLQDITAMFDIGQLFQYNCLIGIGGDICDISLLDAPNAQVTKNNVLAMINRYRTAGYNVAAYAVDAGSAFGTRLRAVLEQTGTRIDPLYGGEHAATAEVMIRTIKYKLRSLIIKHGRKVPNTPNTYTMRYDLIKHAISYVVQRYLMTTRKQRNMSASESLTGVMPCYEDFNLPFLTPVEVTDTSNLTKRNNTNVALTHTCLSLAPLGDGRGGYYFLNLRTKKIIKRARDAYTRLTRMEASTYDDYQAYLGDRAENTTWNLDDIASDIDENDFAGTVFARAVRYAPVPEALQSTPTPIHAVIDPVVNPTQSTTNDENTEVPSNPLAITANMEGDIHHYPETGVATTHHPETGVEPTTAFTPPAQPINTETGVVNAHDSLPSPHNVRRHPTNAVTTTPVHRTRSTTKPAPHVLATSFAIACATVFVTAATIRAKTKEEADLHELRTILSMQTLRPCHYSDIDDKRKLVGCGMIRTQKFDELNNGALLGEKSRLVGYGNNYLFNLDTLESSSPTPRYEHIVSLMLHCHSKGYIFKTGDVKNAYLRASLPNNSHYIRIDKKYVDIINTIDPTWRPYITSKGHAYAEVKRALYGFTEAGKLWHDTVTTALHNIGCTTNKRDPCVFHYTDPKSGDTAHIIVYVDDFMFCGSTSAVMNHITQRLAQQFGDIKLECGPKLQYLNMVIDTSDKSTLKFDMTRYKQLMVDDLVLPTNVMLPGNHQFDNIDPASPLLNAAAKEFFHSKTAQLLYLANHLHGEISYYVNKLCQRVQAPTDQDMQKLLQLLGYIKLCVHDKLELDASHFYDPKVYIDASYAINSDFKSQSGLVMFFGRGSFVCRSHKQHLNVKSSTEAELTALSDMASNALGLVYFLNECGIVFNSVTVYQDNKSTLKMLHKGFPDGKYSRHINIRSYWLKDLVQRKELQLTYISTTDMVADIMTKATPGRIFRRFRDAILGRIRQIDASKTLKQFKLDSIQIAKANPIEGL